MPQRQRTQGVEGRIYLSTELAEHSDGPCSGSFCSRPFDEAELHGERDQVLLGAVVDVAL